MAAQQDDDRTDDGGGWRAGEAEHPLEVLRDSRNESRDDLRGVLPDVSDDLDEASYQRLSGKRRLRLWRQRIVLTVVVVAVLAVGAAAALVYTDRWQPAAGPAPSAEAVPNCQVVEPQLPAPADVTVEVLNGTDQRGLAASVATQLRGRGFVVSEVGNAAVPAGPATAVVTYPSAQLPQALAVGARFEGTQLVEDPAATSVSVSLGDGYRQLLGEDALTVPSTAGTAVSAGC